MTHRHSLARRLAIGLLWLVPLGLLAQTERITIRLAPKPDQIVHYRTAIEMVMDTTVVAAPDGTAALPPMQMEMKMGMASTQIINHPDEQGRFESQVTLDEMTTEVKMNGAPMPIPPLNNALLGRTTVATFDAHGAIVDMKLPPELDSMSAPMKQMLEGFYRAVPVATTIGVGETTTVPYNFALPIPTPGRQPSLNGQVSMKLVAIDQEGPDRIARFEQSLEMTMGPGDSTSGLTFKMSGTGTLEWNLDRGFVKLNDMRGALEGQTPAGQMRGTMRSTMEGTY
jgi:hypothetical protein